MTRAGEELVVAGLGVTRWSGSSASSPPVLGLPGLSSTSATMGVIASALPERTVVSVDLRGRGRSLDAGGPPGLRAHAVDVAKVIDALGLDDVVVVGHSMGAYLALVVASEAAGRVARVVCVDGGIRPSFPSLLRPWMVRAQFRRQLHTATRTWPSIEAIAEAGKFDQMTASRPDLRQAVLEVLAGEVVGAPGAYRMAVDVDLAVADAVDTFFGPDVPAALDALTVPADVLLGSHARRDRDKPFISDKAVAAAVARQQLLRVQRLPGNHVTVLWDPAVAACVAGTA